MTVRDLQLLYDYGYWANDKILGALARLTTEEFVQQVAGSHGSLRNTLVHALSAEWGWLSRCGGMHRGAALVAEDYPTPATLVERWRQVEAGMRVFLASLREEDLERTVEFVVGSQAKSSMSVGRLLHHAAIHGIHHRGQAAMLVRTLGYVCGDFDILIYYGAFA